MYTIVPLAGPDLILQDGSFKPLYPYKDKPMLAGILKNRQWYKERQNGFEDTIFVLRDVPNLRKLSLYLKSEFPGCKLVIIDYLTRGALLSSLAASSFIQDFSAPICVDLVDIDYDYEADLCKTFETNPNISGIILSFKANNPKYSYLKTDGEKVLECAEKKIISNIASAGTYFFKNLNCFLEGVQGSIQNYEEVAYNGSLFICPAFNYIYPSNFHVIHKEVHDAVSLSTIFHTTYTKTYKD